MEVWQMSIPMLADNPLRGVGIGSFNSLHPLQKSPHSIYVAVLVELGVVGLALLLAVAAISLYDALRHPPKERVLTLTLLLTLAIVGIAGNFEYHKTTWLILSLVTISAAIERVSHRRRNAISQEPSSASNGAATGGHTVLV